jgi:peptidoglycan hydrolase CwlO-like protein
MSSNSLLQHLEDLSRRIKSLERQKAEAVARAQELEREKNQAAVTIKALEREVAELGILIATASEKVDRMLKEDAAAATPHPGAVDAPPTATEPERSSKA